MSDNKSPFSAFQRSTDTSESQGDRHRQPALSTKRREMALLHRYVSSIRHLLRLRSSASPNR